MINGKKTLVAFDNIIEQILHYFIVNTYFLNQYIDEKS
jgi:hypothetical protein